jgi:hypothetical protein
VVVTNGNATTANRPAHPTSIRSFIPTKRCWTNPLNYSYPAIGPPGAKRHSRRLCHRTNRKQGAVNSVPLAAGGIAGIAELVVSVWEGYYIVGENFRTQWA